MHASHGSQRPFGVVAGAVPHSTQSGVRMKRGVFAGTGLNAVTFAYNVKIAPLPFGIS
jgi:hypothetical protein